MNNPLILTEPNIPKPLHGLNPRSILGKEWWDFERRKSYAKNNDHCYACGCHKSQDKFHNWLEGHESYSIDYKKGSAELKEIIALCHSCHNFIHSGRLLMLWRKGEVTTEKALYILKRGFYILKKNNLSPFWGSCVAFMEISNREGDGELTDRILHLEMEQSNDMNQKWSDWHITIDGNKYYSKFKSAKEHRSFYI